MLSVYNVQLRNIGRAKCIVCPTNPTVGRATALPAHYVPAPLLVCDRASARMQCMQSAILFWQFRPSVCLSVCPMPILCLNECRLHIVTLFWRSGMGITLVLSSSAYKIPRDPLSGGRASNTLNDYCVALRVFVISPKAIFGFQILESHQFRRHGFTPGSVR